MEDPNKHHMVTLFSMYDSKDTSNDVILDQAVFCLRKCHDAVTMFTANHRFLEAHRQFQHCEDILKERISVRKVITSLPPKHPDGELFAQLEARTFLLQRKFEAQRTAPQQQQFTSSTHSSSPLRGRVGPAPSPAHGGGGLLVHKQVQRRLYASSGGRWQASPPRMEVEEDDSAWSSRPRTLRHDMMTEVDENAVLHVTRVEADSRTFLDARNEPSEESAGPTPPTVVKPDWRQRSQAHVQRSTAVLQSAQEAILAMRRRQEELTGKRDGSIQASIAGVQEAQERAKTRISPDTKRKEARPPTLPKVAGVAAQRRVSRMAERQAELVKAEADLTRRLEKNVERASKTRSGGSPVSSAPEGSTFAGVVLRGLSNVIRTRGSQDFIGAAPTTEEADSVVTTLPHIRQPLLPPRGPLSLLDPQHKLYHLFAEQEDEDTASQCNVNDAPMDTSEDSIVNTHAARARRLRDAHSQRLIDDDVRARLIERVESLAAAGKLESPLPPLKMAGEEIERILSHETAQSLVYRQSTYFPSLMEPEATLTIPCWSVLSKLKRVPDWVRLRPRELMTNLELSMATLKLQCWWRGHLASTERNERAALVYKHVTRHHQELDAVDKILRCFRVVVAKKRVETIRRRVAHVNDQRIDLELNRGVFLEPHIIAASNANRRASSLDATANGGPATSPYSGALLSADGAGDEMLAGRNSRYSGMSPMQRRRLRARRSSRAQTIWLRDDDIVRPFMNPFPHMHPHHSILKSVQRRVAARAIIVAIRGHIFRCFEELQQTSDRCMHHILTGEYIPQAGGADDDDGWGTHQEDGDVGFSADPFAGDGLLAKYSGDLMARIEQRWNGEGDEPSDFMQLKHVKLSVLEAERQHRELAVAQEHALEMEKRRRAAEMELLELQTRNESIAMMQRVGRGFRRRAALHRIHNSHQSDKGRMHQQLGALRVEKMSLSLSGGGAFMPSPANHRESPTSSASGARVGAAIMELIAKRNPDLLPERREVVKQQRVRNVTALQTFCRGCLSVRRVRDLAITKHARTIQRWWRNILRRHGLARDVEIDMRLDYVDEDLA